MSDAKSRYGAADVRYVSALQPEASPARLRYALAVADTHWAPEDPDRLTVLDIGCGRGVTATMLAAANPGWDVIGLDLQPAHVDEARELARLAGLTNARFIEADLAELDEAACARLLPEVDIVICYGVWTWVPDIVREGILRLLRSRVKAGGLVLVGYNAMPGFGDSIVMQRLIEEFARDAHGTPEERGAAAFAAINALREAGAAYLPDPRNFEHLLNAARRAPTYMVHEWMTSFWRPAFHADVVRDMTRARLDFGGCANPGRSLPSLQMTREQRDALNEAPPGPSRETLADMFLARRFRTDIFVRGRRGGGRRRLPDMRVTLNYSPGAAEMNVQTKQGTASLPDDQIAALAAALADGPRTLGELAALPEVAELSTVDLAIMLIDGGMVQPLWRDVPPPGPQTVTARRTAAALLEIFKADGAGASGVLGAPVPALGSGIVASPSDLAVIVELQNGAPADPDLLTQRLVDPDSTSEIVEQGREAIATMLTRRLAAWRMMGVI